MTGTRKPTPDQRRAILDVIYASWLCAPELRLGQMLQCALDAAPQLRRNPQVSLFYISDDELLDALELFMDKVLKLQEELHASKE
jgi:hypothetical protein